MRADATLMIADNPSTITITRRTWVTSGGKRTNSDVTLAPQTVRLYSKRAPAAYDADAGRWMRTREIKMLCSHNADVNAHSNNSEDTFALGGKVYLIKDVRDVTWEGVTVSRQCTLTES
jgi:hypothetical protein